VPKSEIEGDMGDLNIGLQARLMSQALRKLTAVVNKSKTVIIFVNQLREKIGVMFGNPETTPGGRALKFYSSIRLDVRPVEKIKKGEQIVGAQVRVKVVKNKVAPPFKEARFTLVYGEGISRESDIVNLGIDLNLIQKTGAWLSYEGEKIGQGVENALQFLKDNPKVSSKIEAQINRAIADQKPGASEKKPLGKLETKGEK
jgi:recombination protein RecA